eukprot:m.17679 g.17679  ORF g.17679 m.17679 type:complete len:1077 (+) comp5522_c0_seq1:322-3552(+)
MNARVKQVEQLCMQLYEGHDHRQQEAAQHALLQFDQQPDVITACREILDSSQLPYAQHLAATTLHKILTKPSCVLLLAERMQIRNYVLEYLHGNAMLSPYVVGELCKLVACITKLGWFEYNEMEQYVMRNITTEVSKFLDSAQRCAVGMQLLRHLVEEMSRPNVNRGLTKHRKICSSFRDEALFGIFELCLSYMRKVMGNQLGITDPHLETALMRALLELARSCLCFDFIGTCDDESVDDVKTAQIPASWRDVVIHESTLQMFFQLYLRLPVPLSSVAMACLVQLASVRRTLFSNEERLEFLSRLVNGVCEILRTSHGLKDESNYHEFCRLLARLKTNYQLGELVGVARYDECMTLITQCTVISLQNWSWAANSLHYLLGLWERMVASIPYMKADRPHNLEMYAPQVTEAYINCRLQSVEMVIRDNVPDPLEDLSHLDIQLKQVSVIARCQYERTCACIVQHFDPLAGAYATMVTSGRPLDAAARMQLRLMEGQLTWLVYIIGAVIDVRASSHSASAEDYDGELICRALKLMQITDARLQQAPPDSESLDLALLSFFQHFRSMFIGDHVHRSVKVHQMLAERLRLSDEIMVLAVLVNKIVLNLKYWTTSDLLIEKTLKLLNDLCLGYTSVRKLVKLESIKFILQQHTAEHFPFLDSITDTRHRTTFYTALGRILTMDASEDNGRFDAFVRPLEQIIMVIHQQLGMSLPPPQEAQLKHGTLGLVRDLRGLAIACTTKTSYMLLFEWLYPAYFPTLILALERWYNDAKVAVPILKFVCEFVQNRNSRLQFGVSSPNGILLFREVSKVLVAYGQRILSVGPLDPTSIYPQKYKGMTVCFNTLRFALCGEYVNFGVFQLYGDSALSAAMDIFFKLVMAIPIEDLLVYPKLTKAFYALSVAITRDHCAFLSQLDAQLFRYFTATLSEGLKSVDTSIGTQCCTAIDNMLTFVVLGTTRRKTNKHAEALLVLVQQNMEVFSQALAYLLNVVMFEDCKNQWSVSRPMLVLIIMQPAYFQKLQQQVVASLPGHKHQHVIRCFEALMADVESNLLAKNRDKFTHNLAIFRRDIISFPKAVPASTAA